MSRIKEFIKYSGQDNYNEVFEFIEDNELQRKLFDVIDDNEKLFKFSIRYGVLEITKFLFEHINYSYDLKEILEYSTKIGEETFPDDTNVPIMSDTGGTIGLHIEHIDKYGKKREECIKYLINMRKKSRMTTFNKHFYYKFNKGQKV